MNIVHIFYVNIITNLILFVNIYYVNPILKYNFSENA